jgi:hypothetical protein
MIQIDPSIARVLYFLAHRSFPTTTFPRVLEEAKVAGEDWSAYPGTLVFDDQNPKLVFTIPVNFSGLFNNELPDKLWDVAAEAMTEDRETFISDHTYFGGATTNFGGPNEGTRVTIRTSSWQLTKEPVFLWAGVLSEKIPHSKGNLSLHQKDSFHSDGHYRLQSDVYTYYIIRQKEASILVVDTNQSTIKHETLTRDLRIMSFCLGFPINCKLLTGVNTDAKLVSYLGSNFGFYRIRRNGSHALIPLEENAFCFPDLFEKLVRKFVELYSSDSRFNFLYDVFFLYVEYTAEHWNNSREMKLFHACLNGAYCILKASGQLPIIALGEEDDDQYIQVYADDSLKANQYFEWDSQLPVSVLHDALSIVEPEAISKYLPIIKNSFAALLGGQPEDFQASQGRQEALKSLCITLVAHYVGYKGPIEDSSDDKDLLAVKPGIDQESYMATIDEPLLPGDITDLWPIFQEPIIPENSLVGLIDNFAKSLASRTDNRVRARLIPVLMLGDESPQLYDFIIESTRYTLANNKLFTIRQDSATAPLVVVNWDEDIPALTNESQLINFLRSVATAKRTKELIERLLLAVPNE